MSPFVRRARLGVTRDRWRRAPDGRVGGALARSLRRVPSPSRPRGSVPAVPSEVKLAFAGRGHLLRVQRLRGAPGGRVPHVPRRRTLPRHLPRARGRASGVNTLAGGDRASSSPPGAAGLGYDPLGSLRVKGSRARDPLTSGVSQMLAMASSNEALRYVSFATQNLGKSCKMVPVMVGGVVAGKTYERAQYVQVLVMTLGVAASPRCSRATGCFCDPRSDSAYGLGLVWVARDGFRSPRRSTTWTTRVAMNPGDPGARTSMFESMLWTNLGGAFAALADSCGRGTGPRGWRFARGTRGSRGRSSRTRSRASSASCSCTSRSRSSTRWSPAALTDAEDLHPRPLSVARDRSTKLAPAPVCHPSPCSAAISGGRWWRSTRGAGISRGGCRAV